jgi:hypothetical protein
VDEAVDAPRDEDEDDEEDDDDDGDGVVFLDHGRGVCGFSEVFGLLLLRELRPGL